MHRDPLKRFDLRGRVAVVTGGAGLLGTQHAAALADAGARVILADIDGPRAARQSRLLAEKSRGRFWARVVDVTSPDDVCKLRDDVMKKFGRVDILVNNAARDAKVSARGLEASCRLEEFPLARWEREISVGLTGAFLCARTLGAEMAEGGGGVILNIASDLSVLAPDQRLYRKPGVPRRRQPAKPVTYPVIKTALIGLTRYLATYWADRGVRANALSPGGVRDGQPAVFVRRISKLVPLGRMAAADEYRAAVLFLCSDASSYMTGQNVVLDGGRSVW